MAVNLMTVMVWRHSWIKSWIWNKFITF